MKKLGIKKILIGIVGLLVLLCIFGTLLSKNPENINKTLPLSTKAVVVVPSETPMPTLTEESKPTDIPAGLPGLLPVDVKVNLENKGFTCEAVTERNGIYSWTCFRLTGDTRLHVTFFSQRLATVDTIDATAITADADTASEFLGFVSTMPYDGSDPVSARTWVEDSLTKLTGEAGNTQSTTLAGVPFLLYGPEAARTMEMGTVPGEVIPSSRCIPASSIQFDNIQSGVKEIQASNYIKSAWAVKSGDFVDVWMVAATIYGPSMETGTGPGVWAMNGDPNEQGGVLSVDGFADEFSPWPLGSTTDFNVTISSDGVSEAMKCAELR